VNLTNGHSYAVGIKAAGAPLADVQALLAAAGFPRATVVDASLAGSVMAAAGHELAAAFSQMGADVTHLGSGKYEGAGGSVALPSEVTWAIDETALRSGATAGAAAQVNVPTWVKPALWLAGGAAAFLLAAWLLSGSPRHRVTVYRDPFA
jgi:hypothetical protein